MEKILVECTLQDRIAFLTLNHEEKRNALSRRMLEDLLENFTKLDDNRDVKVVILAAKGPVFSSGHDLKELAGIKPADAASLFDLCTKVMEAIRLSHKPVIASVQGLATAAGCQLAATCDLIVASENAAFATPGVKIGLFCTTPAVALARVIPAKKALEMLLTGTPIGACEAEKYGLVNRVVPLERLVVETEKLARQIVAASSAVLGLGKRAFYAQLPLSYPAAYELAQKTMTDNCGLPDAQEGIAAFLEKRKPDWR